MEGSRTATVVVGEDQLSLAIGRDGQNARLAAKLTGWRIDIKSLAEASGDAIHKLQNDAELAALLPAAVEQIPAVEEILAKKAENRPVTPEEYTVLGQFVDRVERRTIQIKEEAARVEEEKVATALADVPAVAFAMPLDQAGIKEHVFNILVEAGIDTVGSLMMKMKLEPNSVLGLPGVGPKAIQNIEESLAAITFPEPPPAEPVVEPVAEAVSQPEAVVAEPAPVEEAPVAEKQVPAKKESKKVVEEQEDDEHAKDGVSLDELFAMKPEIFQTAGDNADEDSADKKKGKKGKKKSVALEFDEERGEVVARKVHKRGGEVWDEE
jgi:N utilization substance protein A